MELINIIIMLLFPFLFIGIINKVKAFWAGRKGAPILQPYYDFFKLLRKGEVISSSTSKIFLVFPPIVLSAVILSGLLTPMANHKAIISFEGSFIVFIYGLGLAKFFAIIGALDTGSSFEGMGAAREAFFTAIPEPAFFMVIGSVSIFQGVTTFENLYNFSRRSELMVLVVALLLSIYFIILLVEGARVPMDDPNTHLELTMIHEVMILDNSGVSFGIMQYAAVLKNILFTSLIMHLIIPYNVGLVLYLAFYMAGIFITAFIIGTIEAMVARFRLVRLPEFLFAFVAMAFMVMFVILLFYYGGE